MVANVVAAVRESANAVAPTMTANVVAAMMGRGVLVLLIFKRCNTAPLFLSLTDLGATQCGGSADVYSAHGRNICRSLSRTSSLRRSLAKLHNKNS